MEQYHLERTGLPPLCFRGRELAYVSSWGHNDNSGYRVTVYLTQAGKYVLHIVYGSYYVGTKWSYDAYVLNSPRAVVETLKEHREVHGGPPADLISDLAEELDVVETIE